MTWSDPVGAAPAVVVLDGGLSNALEDRGNDLSGGLWTARVLRDAPDEVAAVHRSYYRAGARVATTASYQVGVAGPASGGIDPTEARRLLARSVTVARAVRDDMAADGTTRWVAASVGPYGAVLGDGSEYRGRYGLTAGRLRDFHLPRLEALCAAEPDLLAVETIPDVDEAEVLVGLLDELAVPAWFSFTVEGLRTRAGQPLADAFAVPAASRHVLAVGVNCCAPADVLPAIVLAGELTGRPSVAYPNSGEDYAAGTGGWVGDASYDVRLARAWVRAGAGWVGGCCRVGPSDVEALSAVVAAA